MACRCLSVISSIISLRSLLLHVYPWVFMSRCQAGS
jgi:hypothetical protein